MDLKALRYFDEIVRYGSFGKAATGIPLSQPALSKAIRLLEEELCATLIERGRRGVALKLTAAGEAVLRRARAMLERRQLLLADLEALRGLKQGELKLGLPPLGSAELFASSIAEFREQYPGVAIHLREEGSEELEQALRAGELELAVTLLPVRTDLDAIFVHREPMTVAVPCSHRLAERRRVRLHELAHVSFVVLDEGFALSRLVREACLAHGFAMREAASSAQPNFALALVAAGMGVMCLPRLIAQRHANAGVRLIALQGSALDWRVAVAWRKGADLSWAARAWLQLVKAGGADADYALRSTREAGEVPPAPVRSPNNTRTRNGR